jgi:hypothetical protein
MKKLLLLSFCGILLIGCDNEIATPSNALEEQQTTYAIPLDEALNNLSSALENINAEQIKKGLRPRTINEIDECIALSTQQVTGRNHLVKSNTTQKVDTALYIVNFANNQGYAILSASKKLPDDVLVIADKGYLTAAELMREDEYSNLEIDTLNPYCEEDDDYYVGIDKNLTNKLVTNYYKKYSSDQIKTPVTYYYEYTSWKHHSSVAPLVRVKWHQDAPFNNLSPKRCGEPAPAGCVAIAVAQILSANKNVTKLNGVTIDWATMNKLPQPTGDDKDKIANWVRYIAKKCCMIYGCYKGKGYGLATPEKAKKFLKTLSPYKNVTKLKTFNAQTAINMVKAGKPVFISAFHSTFDAHAWVIDGYLKQQRTRTTKSLSTNDVISTTTEYRELIHCNFGWNGLADGYYTPGIFDISAGPIEIDPLDKSKTKANGGKYYYWYRMIIYDF